MKSGATKIRIIQCLVLVLANGVLLAPAAFGQLNLLPTVMIRATVSRTDFPAPDSNIQFVPAAFTVSRTGDAASDLNVYYTIGGTASNGVDYHAISNYVELASGVVSNTIYIGAIGAGQTNEETVILTLVPSPLSPPINYNIGNPNSATVYIDPPNLTNLPPTVAITSPTNGSVFYTPANVSLVATARDLDGFVASVEFFAGTNSLGVVTNWVVVDPLPGQLELPGTRGFLLTWTNAPVGSYSLTAKATDNDGATRVSSPVQISVAPGPRTNLPPVVRITSPANGALYHAPVSLPIYAYATDPAGSVVSVQFFAGTNSLGLGHRVGNVIPPVGPVPLGVTQPPLPIIIFNSSNYWEIVWTNSPSGTYALTAVAADDNGGSATSVPINVTILPQLTPPPTNRPVVVSIVATDPIAIAGTNCWPWRGLASVTPTWNNWVLPTAVSRMFTNCGPKDAVFTVYSFGDTNNDVTINYSIGGTATNGVNYVTLPGSVTVPAGQRTAMITVMPVDSGPAAPVSTVVLKLLPDTNSPADYALGFPRDAAALIINSTNRFLPTPVLPDRSFHLAATGPDGAWFQIQYSTDLLNWTPICTNQVIAGSIDFVDPDAANNNSRFYRTMPEANPPQ